MWGTLAFSRRLWAVAGPSPRMWGTRTTHRECPRFAPRSIPTYVGNTNHHNTGVYRIEVHPHVCGEHNYGVSTSSSFLTVHPHVCGEHASGPMRAAYSHGPSPRMWGTLRVYLHWHQLRAVHPHVCGEHGIQDLLLQLLHRSIPTYVGNTLSDYWVLSRCGAGKWSIPTYVGTLLNPSMCFRYQVESLH